MRHVTVRKPGATSTPKSPRADLRAASGAPRSRAPKPRRHAPARRAPTDDGYRNPLVPGLKATADAERLAVALTAGATRGWSRPGRTRDRRDARPRARDLARVPVRARARAARRDRRGAAPRGRTPRTSTRCPRPRRKTAAAYRAWVERAGSQEAAFTGEEIWTPERRFGRVFERLALPGFTRADALRPADRARRRRPSTRSRPTPLHFVEDDATTLAAKRLLVSGDRMLLERRAQRPRGRGRAADRRVRPRPRRLGHARPSTST